MVDPHRACGDSPGPEVWGASARDGGPGARTTSDPVAHQVAADMQTCGAFQAIDHLADESSDPLSGPHGSTQTDDFIALSSAMNNARAAELSDPLDAAVTTYVYALANLRAVVNTREPIDDIESMRLIVNLSAHTVATVYRRPATDLTSGDRRSPC